MAARTSSGSEISDGTPTVALASTKTTRARIVNNTTTATTHGLRVRTPRVYARCSPSHARRSHYHRPRLAEIHYDNQQFRLRVRDDGAGIDPKVLANYGLDGHYGRYGRLGSRPGFDDARAGATFASANPLSSLGYQRLRSVRPKGVAARMAGSTVRPSGHRPGGRPHLLFHLEVPDHVAWHAERLRRG